MDFFGKKATYWKFSMIYLENVVETIYNDVRRTHMKVAIIQPAYALNADDPQKNFDGMDYYEYLPEGFSKDEKYPLLVHLHGSGARGKTAET